MAECGTTGPESDPDLVETMTRLLSVLPFIHALKVEVVAAVPGAVTVEAPLTPGLTAARDWFSASAVGTIGDIAAVSSCTSALPAGTGMATMDFTVKMLGRPRGTRLRAKGRALQLGNSTCVGSAEISVFKDNAWNVCGTLLATGRRLSLG